MRKLFSILVIILSIINVYSSEKNLGRVTFIAGDPAVINSTGQYIHLRPEIEFSNHSKFKTVKDEKIEIFIPDIALIRVKENTQFLLRYVGDELQLIIEFGHIWFKVISKVSVRWKGYQVKSTQGLFTTETLVNDMLKVSCIDGKTDLYEASDFKTTLTSTERAFISSNNTIDEVNFSINSENIKWMDFKNIRPGITKDAQGKAVYANDSDFILPPGADEELLIYKPDKVSTTQGKNTIVIDFISPRENMVNIGKHLRVAGKINTIMVNSLEIYVDDKFLGNIDIKNFMFDKTFEIENPHRARFLDVVAKDVYGNKAVFTRKLVPDTKPPIITVVPPFNVRKTQFFRGYIEDLTVNIVNVTLNKGTIFEENFNLKVVNGYFEFKMTTDSAQSDAVLIRYGANFVQLNAVDEFGNVGTLKYKFFINKDKTTALFDK
ncbi:MAG: hypothetical protein M0R46_09020 [Candidatus Muirbacterium halophilum]|nr:hypothetical protein [Candidatus Muirbacterium halophilum]MCK9476047.1 hypothetical protein [Candidatus Muirbacterium halophilum]